MGFFSAKVRGEGDMRSLIDTLQALLRDLPGLFNDRVLLFALEVKRASNAFAQIAMLMVAVAVLGVTAWLALWAGIAVALIQAGLAWGWVFLMILVVNIGAAAIALLRMRKLALLLGLPATMRHLTIASIAQAESMGAPVNSRDEHAV